MIAQIGGIMEKTILYALQEKYIEGYNDAREAIAKQIESGCIADAGDQIIVCEHCKNSADIARGKYGNV
jgi:DNA-binding transcriptional MocR family regulator